MERELTRNRQATEQLLLSAVHELVGAGGFEKLGINAVAAKAGIAKTLIYRYFGSLDGLIAAYIRQHDFWINFDMELPGREALGSFIRELFARQIAALRENGTLRKLYRWELTSDNRFVDELRARREEAGLRLVRAVGERSGRSLDEVAVLATLVSSSVTYLALLSETCPAYNGISLVTDEGWLQLADGIGRLADEWLTGNI